MLAINAERDLFFITNYPGYRGEFDLLHLL